MVYNVSMFVVKFDATHCARAPLGVEDWIKAPHPAQPVLSSVNTIPALGTAATNRLGWVVRIGALPPAAVNAAGLSEFIHLGGSAVSNSNECWLQAIEGDSSFATVFMPLVMPLAQPGAGRGQQVATIGPAKNLDTGKSTRFRAKPTLFPLLTTYSRLF